MTDFSNFLSSMTGDWSGTYRLWLHPGAEVQVSQSNAHVSVEGNGAYAVMSYDWVWKEKPQSGVFLFEGPSDHVTATWGDSWHQQPATMRCEGSFSDEGKLVVLGSYSGGEGPDWGWRTQFNLVGEDSMVMEVYNITPDGQEALAVRAEYKRDSS